MFPSRLAGSQRPFPNQAGLSGSGFIQEFCEAYLRMGSFKFFDRRIQLRLTFHQEALEFSMLKPAKDAKVAIRESATICF